MDILVLQLARFGDLFQTWPVLKALQRAYPQARLHVLARARFADALEDLPNVVVHALPSKDILAPILLNDDLPTSQGLLETFLETLSGFHFRQIINLSFSPVSSYIVDALKTDETDVRGYTRFTDGFLNIPDDASAYFYAQVGIDRANRYHLTDVFAAVAGVDLIEFDFSHPAGGAVRRDQIVVHLGASQVEKTYPPELWREVLIELSRSYLGDIVVVGSANEAAMAATVCRDLDRDRVHNRVGQSSLQELMNWLAESALLIGADSAPVHMAALVGTPVLNLSCASVNFWETGPRSARSRILYADRIHDIQPARVSAEALAVIENSAPTGPCILRTEGIEGFEPHQIQFDDFSWSMIKAIYTASDYPKLPLGASSTGFQRLIELADLALAHLEQWTKQQMAAARVLANVDTLLVEIPKLDPRTEPLVNWFQTERLRIGPNAPEAVLERTKKLFSDLLLVASQYRPEFDAQADFAVGLELCRSCAPLFREFETARAQESFQKLLSTCHDLARHSTMVGDRSWSSVLSELGQAFDRRDFVDVADQLEHVLAPALAHHLT